MVLEVRFAGRQLVLGLIADRVYEVASLDNGRLEPPPDIGAKWRSEYIRGVGRRGEHFVVVFDLGRLFASDEPAFIGAARIDPSVDLDAAALIIVFARSGTILMRITVKRKLALTFAAVIVLSAITAVARHQQPAASLNATLDRLVRGPTQRVSFAGNVHEQLLAIVRSEKNPQHGGIPRSKLKHFDAELAKLRPEFTARLKQVEATASAEGKPLWAAALIPGEQLHRSFRTSIIDVVRHDLRQQAHDLSMGAGEQLSRQTADLGEIVDPNRQTPGRRRGRRAELSMKTRDCLLIGIVVAATLIAIRDRKRGSRFAFSRGMARATRLAQSRRDRRPRPGGRGHQQRRNQGHGGRAQSNDRQFARYRGGSPTRSPAAISPMTRNDFPIRTRSASRWSA